MGLARPLPKGVAAVLVRLRADRKEYRSRNSISKRHLARGNVQNSWLGCAAWCTTPLLYIPAQLHCRAQVSDGPCHLQCMVHTCHCV